ncbi:MAG TPA: phytoene desaturase family protein [Bacteroidia bacterium]
MSRISVIGSGFSGLSAACFLAREGHSVTVHEKNSMIGGRARYFYEQGFTFDMGPSWYWMPDVFEDFFAAFGKTSSDYYELVKLDPGFQIIFGKGDVLTVPAEQQELFHVFESIEKGSSAALKKFLREAEFKYDIGMKKLVYKPAFSWTEFASLEVLEGISKTHLFKSVSSYVRSYFKNPKLIALMEFPVLFLGAMPNKIPALYSLMNHAALSQGTFYPLGGMYKIVEGMHQLACSLGVEFKANSKITKINVAENKVVELVSSLGTLKTDGVVASADYRFVEQQLLDESYRNYNQDYWDKKILAPSALIYFVGVSKRINKLQHHNLFFDANFDQHSAEIYADPRWPANPLFYVCCTSKTDPAVAPSGMENLFILVPIAAGLNDSEPEREKYFNGIIKRIENFSGDSFSENVIYKRSYCVNDFVNDYNAYKGNAYGLANTLTQTAVLKPTLRNKKINNLFYTGQFTVPGPGVPPALISGRLAAKELHKQLVPKQYETIIR